MVFGDDIIGCSRQASQMKMFISGNVFSIMNRTLEKTPSGKEYYKCSDRILKGNISPFKYVNYVRTTNQANDRQTVQVMQKIQFSATHRICLNISISKAYICMYLSKGAINNFGSRAYGASVFG